MGERAGGQDGILLVGLSGYAEAMQRSALLTSTASSKATRSHAKVLQSLLVRLPTGDAAEQLGLGDSKLSEHVNAEIARMQDIAERAEAGAIALARKLLSQGVEKIGWLESFDLVNSEDSFRSELRQRCGKIASLQASLNAELPKITRLVREGNQAAKDVAAQASQVSAKLLFFVSLYTF